MRLPLAAVLLLLAPLVRAAPHPCEPVVGIGCFYRPPAAGSTLPLLIYLRGHYRDMAGNVPPSRATESSQEAFTKYGLGAAADSARSALLVTYRSGLAVTEKDVRDFAAARGLTFTQRVVAAHSGGHVALGRVLDNGLEFERVIVLDSFYSGSPALAQKIQARFPSGACRGFYTPHSFQRRDGSTYDNEANFRANFRAHAGGCAVDRLAGGQHDPGVNRCLPAYLADKPCL